MEKNTETETVIREELNLLQTALEDDSNILLLMDDTEVVINAAKKRDIEDEDEIDDDNDFYHEEDEEKENPFDREPTEKDINDDDIPIVNPEDDLLDDEDEIPFS